MERVRRSFLNKLLLKNITSGKKDPVKVTHVSTAHIVKVKKLLFFETGNIANSVIKIILWMCFYCFSVTLSQPYEIQRRKNFVIEIDTEIFLVCGITFLTIS